MRSSRVLSAISLVSVLAAAHVPIQAEDWPEWRGKGRQGVWEEEGILKSFPEAGLKYTWRVPIGEGYSGPVVSGGRVFLTDFVRKSGIRGIERALCLDEQTGKLLWKHEWKVDYAGTQPTWASGPRATPTVAGDGVYVLGGMGRLFSFHAGTGEIRWEHDLVAKFGAEIPNWGVTSAPLVHEKLLIVLVGGEEGATVVALDLVTGQEVWRALSAGGDPGYAPPVMVHAGGVDQLIIWHPKTLASLNPRTGKVYWEHPMETRMGLTVATPVSDGKRLLLTSFFDGTTMLSLDADKPGADVLWHRKGKSEEATDTEALHSLITTPVMNGEFFYGIGSYGELRGLKTEQGDRIWATPDLIGGKVRWGAGLIVRHGDRYFINNDRGELVIAQLTPEGYEEIDRTKLIEPTSKGGGRRELGAVHWSHPAYANRHIIVRNDKEIVRASLAAPGEATEKGD